MADFDVGAVSLSVPPASAVIQSYRPAVSVRNNGVHDALAVGSIRIYHAAGLLIYTSELYSGTIAPGETKPAQAVDYWLPPAIGKYQVIAYVTCINDQYEPNNNLAPVFVDIIPGEPEPPTPVQMHAAQHEEGGGDELNIDGLHGRAVDAQTPIAHKTSHQVAGSDALNVTGLPGILADRQPIAEHHEEHEDHGTDELNVDDLHGVLYNLQKPQVHANEAHDPNFSAKPHGNADHDPNFCPLDENDLVTPGYLGTGALQTGRFLHSDQTWIKPNTSQLFDNASEVVECSPGTSTILLTGTLPAGSLPLKSLIRIYVHAGLYNPAPGPLARFRFEASMKQPSDPVWRSLNYVDSPPLLSIPLQPNYADARLDFWIQPDPDPGLVRTAGEPRCSLLPYVDTVATPLQVVGYAMVRQIIVPEPIMYKVVLTVPDIADCLAYAGLCAFCIDRPTP
jgi:hypothetical protein